MNPILLDIPMPIETPRLLLRPPQAGDGADLNAAILESFEELQTWMPWMEGNPPPVEKSEENVRRAYAQWILREDLRLSIFDRATGRLASSTGLHRIRWNLPSFEIGYWARSSFVGRGYITEAVNALTRFTFQQLGAKRVEIRCDFGNHRSISVAKRLGFELEGTLRQESRRYQPPHELRDTEIFSRLHSDRLPELDVKWPRA